MLLPRLCVKYKEELNEKYTSILRLALISK